MSEITNMTELMGEVIRLREQLEGVQKVRDEYHQQWMDASDAEEAAKQQLATARQAVWEEATSQYRDHFARKLQLDHPAKQRYSKTDIIVALDQIENEIDALPREQAKTARRSPSCPAN